MPRTTLNFMKTKKRPLHEEHHFTLIVTTLLPRKSAELAVLAAFAFRSPDSCSFAISKEPPDKLAFMAGARSGAEMTIDLVSDSIAKLRKKIAK